MNTGSDFRGLDGRAVANFILDFCDARKRPVTHLSLQKILYFCHVWSLIELKRPLIRHQFEAWQYGPVLQYLYREFSVFDNNPVKGRATELDPSTGKRKIAEPDVSNDLKKFLYPIVDFYTRLSASYLVELSHAKGGPWDKAWNHKGTVNPGMKIDNGLIVEFYSKIQLPFTLQ